MLVPGFVDAHVHIESSMLTLERFAEVVLARGTTTIVADPHELANVVGADGVHWLLDAAAKVPLNVFVMAPSCVPASRFESPRAPLEPDDMEAHPATRRRSRRGRDDGLPGRHRRRGRGTAQARHARRDSCRRPRARRERPRPERLPGRGHRVRSRGDHLRGGAREAPQGRLDPDPRSVQRAQPRGPAPARPALRPGALRVLHGRPRGRRPARRGPHRRHVQGRCGRRPGRRGRPGARDPQRRRLSRPRGHRRHRPGLPGRLLPAARRGLSPVAGLRGRPPGRGRRRGGPARDPAAARAGSRTRSGWGRSRRPTSRSRRAGDRCA